MFIFCQHNGKYKVYDGKTHTIQNKQPKNGLNLDKIGYDENKTLTENLETEHKIYCKWFMEISESIPQLKLKLKDFKSDSNLTYLLFKIYRGDRQIEFDPVNCEEVEFINNCYRGGLIYHDIGEYENVKAYDFTKFYPNILGANNTQFKIPVTKGQFKIIDELPEKLNTLQYGIYRVKITSNYDKIRALFAFTKDGYYTHIDLKFADVLKYHGLINKIELVKDGEYNAMVYNELVDSKIIFSKYVQILLKVNKKYPKNGLIKNLLSRLWGRLQTKNKVSLMTEEQYLSKTQEEKNKLWLVKDEFKFNSETYETTTILHFLKSARGIYTYNYRLTPFLQAQGRLKMASKIIDLRYDIVRVYNDGVIFKNNDKTNKQNKGAFIYDTKYNNKNLKIGYVMNDKDKQTKNINITFF
jgi:hypothetical protein